MLSIKKISFISLFISLIMASCLTIAMFIRENFTKTNFKKDLEFIHETIVENHPGMYNELDPNFKEDLERNYKIAQESLLKESNINEQQKIIMNFTESFNDNHLKVWLKNDPKKLTLLKENLGLFEITDLNDQISWVTLPTFEPNKEQQENFKEFLKKIPSLRHKKAIIFDIRAAYGGDSSYGDQIIENLFGEDYANNKKEIVFKNEFSEWRASDGNLNYIKSRYGSSRTKIVEGMKKSLAQKKPYYRESDFEDESANLEKQSDKQLSHDVTAKIFLVTSSRNASAVLDFIDAIKAMGPKITLVGQKTGADKTLHRRRTC